MKFIRFGGLSSVVYKPKNKFSTYHSPPVKRGLYAFIWPYAEPFLWAWKFPKKDEETEEERGKRWDKFYRDNKKEFEYDGPLWTHLFAGEIPGCVKGSWTLTDTDELEKLINKVKSVDAVILKQQMQKWVKDFALPIDPYKRGLGGMVTKDHMEVFIEQKHLGKIK